MLSPTVKTMGFRTAFLYEVVGVIHSFDKNIQLSAARLKKHSAFRRAAFVVSQYRILTQHLPLQENEIPLFCFSSTLSVVIENSAGIIHPANDDW